MRVADRLRNLDNRVLGKPKPVTAEAQRRTFLTGLAGAAVVLIVVAVTGRWHYLAAIGGFVGVTVGAALRWRKGSAGTDR